jgi:hypothetical protein
LRFKHEGDAITTYQFLLFDTHHEIRGSVSRVIHFLLERCSYTTHPLRHSTMRLTRRLHRHSLAAYLDLHPRRWPFQRSHLPPQRVNSTLVTEVFSEHRLSSYDLQPHPCHLIDGRFVSAPELCLSTGTLRARVPVR